MNESKTDVRARQARLRQAAPCSADLLLASLDARQEVAVRMVAATMEIAVPWRVAGPL